MTTSAVFTCADLATAERFGNRPGRPRKVDAVTLVECVRKHRAAKTQAKVFVTSNENCNWCGAARSACSGGICNIGQLG